MKLKFLATIALSTAISSCASGLPKVNAISASRIDKVLSEIKRQLSVYESQALYLHQNPAKDADLADAQKAGLKCGKGRINFEITAIDAELTTTSSTSVGGSVSVGVVVPGGSIGPSVSGSHAVEDTQKLKFSVYPDKVPPTFTYSAEKSAPIADLLFKLRAGFLRTATQVGACYYTYNPKSDNGGNGNTYEIGLTVTDEGKGEVSIKLAPVEAGFNGEGKSVTGNTLTVHFAQRLDQRKSENEDGKGGATPRGENPVPQVKPPPKSKEEKTGD
ncbi:hypothetical protein [Rhizobium brockwellii]|uniref:hypothetical protein n=1 Tax=Rhizobium TaxID=379 RepID=UPI003F9A2327